MKKILKSSFLCLIAILIAQGCKPKDGAPGPAGNANIQTYIFSTSASDWAFDATVNGYSVDHSITQITQAVVNTGTVQIFLGDGTGNVWEALPLSLGVVEYLTSYQLGKVSIGVLHSDGTAPSNPGVKQFKVVVIPAP